MQLTIDFWQLLYVLGGLMTACITVCGVIGRLLLSKTQQHLDERFANVGLRLDGIEAAGREEAQQWREVERQLANLKAELPVVYVRREDYIRGQSVIEVKLDNLALELKNAQLRGLVGVGHGND